MVRLCVLLLALGALRTGAALVDEPLAAYADNTDGLRTMSVFGLKPADGSPFHAPPTAWIPGRMPDRAWPSSDLVVTAAARALDGPALHARTRGGIGALALLGVVAWLVRRWARVAPAGAVGLAALYALVLADPVHTLWLCTLYAESTALLGLVAACGALGLLAREDRRAGSLVRVVAVGGLLLLGLSRMAHLALPAVLCLAAGLPRGRRRAVWIAAAIAPVAWLLWREIADNPYTRAVHLANGVDTLLGLWLPRSADPAGNLDWILGERAAGPCARFLGQDWYSPDLQNNLDCVGIASLRSRAMLPLIWLAEPTLLPRVAWDLLEQTRPWTLGYLGDRAGSSLGDAVLALPAWPHRAGWVALVAWGLSRREARMAAAASLAVYASCLVGDGSVELAKHAQLLQATGPWLLGCALHGIHSAASRRRAGRVEGPMAVDVLTESRA